MSNITTHEEYNPKARLLSKFYARLRNHINELQDDSSLDFQVDPIDATKGDGQHIPEDRLHANITRQEFEEILAAYERQRQDPKNKNKPVSCNKVVGGSYAKLLFSKPGFHNLDSTSYLVKDLSIIDLQRDSFLGGHMKYAQRAEDDIKSLLKVQERMQMREIAAQAETLLAQMEWQELEKLIEDMAKIDKNNPDFLWTRGRYYLAKSEPNKGVEDLRRALESRPQDTEIKKWLSDGLLSLSQRQYQMRQFQHAYNICREALEIYPSNTAAQLHSNMCRGKINLGTPFAPKPLQPRK